MGNALALPRPKGWHRNAARLGARAALALFASALGGDEKRPRNGGAGKKFPDRRDRLVSSFQILEKLQSET